MPEIPPTTSKPQVQSQQSTVQNLLTHKGINWLHVLIGVVVGLTLIGSGYLVYSLSTKGGTQTSYSTKNSTPSSKKATPSSRPSLETMNCIKATKEAQVGGEYINNKYKYSLKALSDFILILYNNKSNCIADKEQKSNADSLHLIPIKYQKKLITPGFYLEFGPIIALGVYPDEGLSLENWLNKRLSDSYTVKSRQTRNVAGENALEFISDGANSKQREVIIKKFGKIYEFSASMLVEKIDLTEDLNEVLSTFKFL